VLSDLGEKEVPEAYMAYSLYNSDSVEVARGKHSLSEASKNKHEFLSDTLKVEEDGYIEVYLVNETSENVWFDDFTVQSTTPIIVQESHYYPFGSELTGLAYNYNNHTNREKFNGKELLDDLNLNLYDHGARLFDPTIGRWISVDPMADMREWISPYNFVQNNPILRIDPTGALDTRYEDKEGNLLLETNDGSDDVVTVSNERVENFRYFGESYKNDAMRPRYDSKNWNDNMKAELLGFETTNEMNGLLDQFTTQWSRQNAIDFLQDPSLKNAMAMSFSEALSQWTDPEKVMTGLSIGAGGLMSMRSVVTKTSVGPIKGYTRHGLNQAISRNAGRGVHPSAIKDAALNPVKVIEQSGGRMKYVGQKATVILNSEGKVITTYGTPRAR
jgi:RHS repeat-associated protein